MDKPKMPQMLRVLGFVSFLGMSAIAATVFTAHFDNSRTNWNAGETALTPSNVATGKFGRLGSYAVDGAVYGQPLYIPDVTVSSTVYDLVITCTMHNSCYAFNANSPGSSALWHASLGTSRTSYPGAGAGNDVFYNHEVGCQSTPVVDVANSVIYVACSVSTPNTVLYQLSLTTGAQLASVIIAGSNGGATFNPAQQNARPALTLANGKVYIAFAGFNDISPWHGWVFAYDSSLTRTATLCITPTGDGGGIWQSGGGLAVDGAGNLYAATGNGDYDGVSNFGMSVIKMSTTLSILDWWTPSNYAALNADDLDISSGRAMLVPGTSLVVAAGKDYRVLSIDSTCMGHLQGSASSCTAAQVFFTNPSGPQPDQGIYGAMLTNGAGYWPNAGKAYRFTIAGSTWNTTATTSAASYAYPGAMMTGSSNSGANGIVWATTASANAELSPKAGTLRALNPSDFSEYWNSDIVGSDALGTLAKFASPTVADGKVFVATFDSGVAVYGLIPSAGMRGKATQRGAAVQR